MTERTSWRRRIFLLVAAILVGLAATARAQSGLEGCRVGPIEAKCGRVAVPENRGDLAGRQIRLRVIVLPAASRSTTPPLFVVEGGPGAATTGMAELFITSLAPLRRNRDIVLMDQRGTGGSNALRCRPAAGRLIVPDDARACVSQLSTIADLRFYGTDDAARDIDAVRDTLEYDRIDLFGISYGTRVAWWYAKSFPERLRSIVMVSPNPPTQRVFESVGENTDRALRLISADCRSNGQCARAFDGFATQLRTIAEKLKPAHRIVLPLLLYSVDAARRLPWLVREAFDGNTSPLEDSLDAFLRTTQTSIRLGLHLTVQCSEEFPVNRRVEHTLSSAVWDEYAAACEGWPRAVVPHGFREPFVSTARALIIAGEWDPATPPQSAEEMARVFADARTLTIPEGTHGLSGIAQCLGNVMTEFLEARPVRTACLNEVLSRRYFVTK